MKELTIKQQRFCEEYVKVGNGAEAYKRAYNAKKDETARVNASKLLTKTNIIEYIKSLNNEVREKSIADINDCLKILTELMSEDKPDFIRLKAVDMRLKTLGAYLEKRELSGDIIITVEAEE